MTFWTSSSGTPGCGQVPGEHERFAGDLARRLLGDVAVEVVDQDLRALLGEQLRGRASDSACRAGDDRHLVIEHCHVQASDFVVEAGHHASAAANDAPRSPDSIAPSMNPDHPLAMSEPANMTAPSGRCIAA